MTRPLRFRPVFGAATVAILLLTGCSPSGTPGGTSMSSTSSLDDAVRQLQTRPDIDQAMARYNTLIEQVKTALTQASGIQPWTKLKDGDSRGCSEFGPAGTELNAGVRETTSWSAPGIPEGRWPQALEAVKRVVGAAGFTTTEAVKNEPGHHVLFLHGPDKSVLYIGTAKRTSTYLTSGCHRLPGKPIDPDHPQNT
jgi:hypothetical protein